MTTRIHISPELIALFNEAADFARSGRFEDSLETWNRLLEPGRDGNQPTRFISGDFLGQACMRKAWVLMDLGRHAEARRVFEDPVLRGCLGQFSLSVLYEYFFSYGNTLGNLGDIAAMDDALTRAMNIAADELGDPARMHLCWSNLLEWAEGARAWEYLDVETITCIQFASNVGDKLLEIKAKLARALALARLGRKAEALEIVKAVTQMAEAAGQQDRVRQVTQAMNN